MGDLNEIQAARAMELDHTRLIKSKKKSRAQSFYIGGKLQGLNDKKRNKLSARSSLNRDSIFLLSFFFYIYEYHNTFCGALYILTQIV